MKIIPFDDYNNKIPPPDGTVGTLTTNWGNSAPRHGWKLIEIYEADRDMV